MDDDLVVEDGGGVGGEFVRSVGKLRPRIGDRVVGFGQVGLFFNRGVGSRVKEHGHAAVGDELATEGNEFEGVALVVHVRHLGP